MNYKEMHEYIEELYKKENDLNRKEYIDSTDTKDFIPVVDQDVSRFLALMLEIKGAKDVLEIGTSIGYSTVSMAQAIRKFNGKVTTIEYDERVAAIAKENFLKIGLDHCIHMEIGDALEVMPRLDKEYDVIFLDVDKNLYVPLLKDCIRLLKTGGMLIAEDTLFPVIELDEKWHDLIEPIHMFNKAITDVHNLKSTLLPIGDGVTVAVKI